MGFGTGRFISSDDIPGVGTQQVQSIYGIKDDNSHDRQPRRPAGTNHPVQGHPPIRAKQARGFEKYSLLTANKKGWYISLGHAGTGDFGSHDLWHGDDPVFRDPRHWQRLRGRHRQRFPECHQPVHGHQS